MIQLEHSVTIDAPPEEVWAVLIDLPSYGSWNPFLRRIEGAARPAPGVRLTLHTLLDGKPHQSVNQVVELCAPGFARTARLSWAYDGRMTFGGLLTGLRQQILEPLPDGRTRYVNKERLGGWLVGLIPEDTLRRQFIEASVALKAHCEQQPQAEVA